jgi:hypothetical protein
MSNLPQTCPSGDTLKIYQAFAAIRDVSTKYGKPIVIEISTEEGTVVFDNYQDLLDQRESNA